VIPKSETNTKIREINDLLFFLNQPPLSIIVAWCNLK